MSESLRPHVACQALLSMGFWWDWWSTVHRVAELDMTEATYHAHTYASIREGRKDL